jgi:hypothetical protein
LSSLEGIVIKGSSIDEPLALAPPRLLSFDWNRGQLTLTLDRPVNGQWTKALQQMGRYTSLLGKGPSAFVFKGNQAFVGAEEREVQTLIDYFKSWLPIATETLKRVLEEEAQREENRRREQLCREREAEEQRLRVLSSVRL